MVHIFNVEYNKEEEKILGISGFVGIFFGIPAGILLCYWIGLFANVNLASNDIIGWTVFFLFKMGSIIIAITWATTFVLHILLFRRRNWMLSRGNVERMLLSTSLVPLIFAYTFSIFGLVFVPLNAFLIQYLNPFLVMSVGALVFFPFAIVFLAIVLPDTPAGKGLRRFMRRLAKRGKR